MTFVTLNYRKCWPIRDTCTASLGNSEESAFVKNPKDLQKVVMANFNLKEMPSLTQCMNIVCSANFKPKK